MTSSPHTDVDPEASTHIQQQEIVAELGQQALETDDLDQLMHDAAVAVAETFDNEYAKVLELLPDGDEGVLRQGVGWREGVVGNATVPTDLDSQAGYTLKSEQPVVSDDLRTEERFSCSDLLLEHEVVSGISVVIGSVEEPWGVLGTHTTERCEFTEHDANFVQSVANVLALAIENETAVTPGNTDTTGHREAEPERTSGMTEPERERRLYETIVSSTPDLVYAFDLEYRFVFANDALLDMWGQTLEESLGKTLLEVGYEPWHAEMHEREIDQVVETKEPVRGEVGFDHAELGHRIYDYIFAPVLDDEGEVEAIAGTTRDITERKEAEEALQESKERFRALVNASSDVVYRMSPDWSEMHLLDGRDLIADTRESTSDWLEKYIHPDDRERVTEAIDEATRTRSTFEQEHRVEQLDGSVGWMFSRAVPMLDEDGDIVEWIGMAADITEQKERERELERALDLLEKTGQIADVGGWEIDPETMEVFWTEHIYDLLEVPYDEEPPLDEALDMYHEDDQPIIEKATEKALDSGHPLDEEVRIRTSNGEIRWLRLQGVPETVDGDVVSFRGAAQDVTERKERERELETLFEVLPVGVVVANADGKIVEANDTAHQIWGGDVFDANSVEEYERYPVRWVDSDEPVSPEEMTLARVVDGEEVTDPDILEIDAIDGETRIVELQGMPIRDEDGDVIRGVVTMHDVTERREAQRQLAESERLYRTLAEHFPNGVVGVYDYDLRYSLAAGDLIGDPAPSVEEVEGSRLMDLYPDEVVEDLEPLFRAAIEDGETGSTRTTVVGRRWQVWATPLRDADGEIFAGLSFAQDITEQIEREEKLAELVERLEESNERLEQFAYAASHDLQEPLRMVSSYLQLLENRYSDELDEDAEEFLEFAVDGADRMREMIDGLLEYSRVDTQGDPLEPVDLDQLVADVQEDLQMQIVESGARITIEDLPRVDGDDSQLRQVFQNLFSNAITYSGNEEPQIRVEADRRGRKWLLSVHDEGIGIDPGDRERVFEVFQRLHGREEHPGTGIGLALCQRIVERHGGRIWVDSEPGEGSTFSFTLPAVDTS